MLRDLIGKIWLRMPDQLKNWAVRFTQQRFTVTVGAVISDEAGRVLLLHHRFRPGSGWGMPGGFIELGEQPEEALRRELREEVELEVQQVELFATRAFKRPHQIEIVFRGRALGETDQLSFEIKRVAWFHLDELPRGLPPDQARLIKLALANGAETPD